MAVERQEHGPGTDNERCTRCRKPKDKGVTTRLCPKCLEYVKRYFNESSDERKRKRKAAAAARRVARKAEGLCCSCDNMAEAGYTLCTNCIRRGKKYNATHYTQRKTGNICTSFGCNNLCEEDRTRCAECSARHNKQAAALYHKKKAAGLCVCCPLYPGVPVEPGYVVCRRHLDEQTFKNWVRNHPGQDPVIA